MDSNTFILAIIGSAAFGAVLGKILDAFLISKITEENEKKRWLRQAKLEAFSNLSEEILSLGFKKGYFDNPWKFKSLGSKTILLLDDEDLVNEISEFIKNISRLSQGDTQVESNIPDDFSIEIDDGLKAGKKEFEKGVAIEQLEKKAESIVLKLGKNIRNT